MIKFKLLILISVVLSFASGAFADESKTEGSTQCLTATAASPDGTCADSITPPAHSTGPTLLGDNTNPKASSTPTGNGGGSKPGTSTGSSAGATGDGRK